MVNKCFKGKDLTEVDSHTINYGYIIDNDKVIDQVLVTIMKSPKTYTKEDVVEINCHGGIATTNKILELMVSKVAREVAKSKVEVKLDPMNLYERRVIYNILNDDRYVYTESTGVEPNRCVVIKVRND